MNISKIGIEFIKQYEGCRLIAYKCPAGILTIGYGHTGLDVTEGLEITQGEAETLLRNDLAKFEDCVTYAVEVELDQNQFDALVSFAYNVGCAAMAGSTLVKLLNSGDDLAAAQQFPRWAKAGGKTVAGLLRRREAEKTLFLA